ncbi:uncharacterized protein LOC123711849 [Pieris brassicae]|uniref:Cuticle protein n=1 Tax=Pieris brassicae TaxID=7116 RepID=A0A9P0T8G0_PIEBR|nr:uncharacterized protein LOC123711849 [Pieris brassicae]CAH3996476.1 unnamed protein product [Pieris brassicae]
MLRIIILSITLGVAVNSQAPYSAASESQRRFALENRYDDTGPGAKGPEYAYNTYKTLQEALVSYIDDADTKLPEHERAKVEQFVNTDFSQPIRELPKTVEEYTGLKQPSRPQLQPLRRPIQPPPIRQQEEQFSPKPLQYQPILSQPSFQPYPAEYRPEKLFLQGPNTKYSFPEFRSSNLKQSVQSERLQPYRLQRIPGLVNQAYYTQNSELYDRPYDSQPQYTFSYGVHDKKTGDSKSAHESRNGGSVKGYYTFVDPDGKQRTVHYTADDKYGFRASVQHTHMNTQ